MLDFSKYENKKPWPVSISENPKEEQVRLAHEYCEESRRLRRLFRLELEAEFGVSIDHPKAKLLFDIAWGYGHSSGYVDVYQYYSNLVELIK